MDGKRDSDRNPRQDADRRQHRRRQLHFSVTYLIASLILLWIFQEFVLAPLAKSAMEIPYSDFKAKLKAGQVSQVTLGDGQIHGLLKSTGDTPTPFYTVSPANNGDPKLIDELDAAGVQYSIQPPASPLGAILLSYVLPMGLLAGFWYFAYRRMGSGVGGLSGVLGVGKSTATKVKPEDVGVTFKDVGGADEAIAELQEVIQFLKAPQSFARLGGRIPKGVLLVGPPGTGKTLLAKACAGEAQVPFFETSGSEFVEMFVGVGAARVRDLFEQARQVAPAIIFIDEIDAIGQSRAGAVRLNANDEREQTLNQLLAEIDGFKADVQNPVIIMAATNRPEVLDPALLRAGRFDRQIAVDNPDLIGRIQILKIHTRHIKLSDDFDLERAARITPGFSGADLANVVNEAALLAARRNAPAVTVADFEAAIERVVAGLERKTRVMNEQERRSVAYHESGHALVAHLAPHADPVAKISIIPRGRGALGYTLQMPTEDRYLLTEAELEDRIAVMLGGRAAEQVVLGTISTGASDDIEHASDLARRMVTEFGMSRKLGSVRYAGQQYQYLGGAMQDNSFLSPETLQVIDAEVQRIITEQYERAQALLSEHRGALDSLAHELLEHESLDGSAVLQALQSEGAATA